MTNLLGYNHCIRVCPAALQKFTTNKCVDHVCNEGNGKVPDIYAFL